MKVFDLAAALRGEPVWHAKRKVHVENLTQVGTRVAYTVPEDGDMVYSCLLNGNGTGSFANEEILVMKPKTRTLYVNLWDSPSFHYTTYGSRLAAMESSRVSPNSHKAYKKLNPEPTAITIED